jgi:hypothetical protein
MKKFVCLILFSLIFLLPEIAQACPACAGSLTNPKDRYLVYILGVFVLLTYIPMYFLYRMIRKNKDLNVQVAASSGGEGN